jgi:hypothetical protein
MSAAAASICSFHFHITVFHIDIDRASVSQHETALLIFGPIPTLIHA